MWRSFHLWMRKKTFVFICQGLAVELLQGTAVKDCSYYVECILIGHSCNEYLLYMM